MSLDTVILFEYRGDERDLICREWHLEAMFSEVTFFDRLRARAHNKKLPRVPYPYLDRVTGSLARRHPKANYQLVLGGTAFYDEGSPRGPWPWLAGMLMALLGSPGVRRVWYGHDADEKLPLVSANDVLRITAFYFAEQRRRRPREWRARTDR